MTASGPLEPTDDDLALLITLVEIYRNVPPDHEQPFRIYEHSDLFRGSQPATLQHPGLPKGEDKPDWAALRRLAELDLVKFETITRDFALDFPSIRYEVVDITDHGFETADEVLAEIIASEAQREGGPMNNEVWVVYGRNRAARDLIFQILRSVDLKPLDFADVDDLTESTSPYIGEVLAAAFERAQAFVILLTDDEEVCLREEFREDSDSKMVEYQSRPNVIFEAGMGMALYPQRTIIVEMGNVRRLSDLSGRHVVRWSDGNTDVRLELLNKLKTAGCPVNYQNRDWPSIGSEVDTKFTTGNGTKPCGPNETEAAISKAGPPEPQPMQSDLAGVAVEISAIANRLKGDWLHEYAVDRHKIQPAQRLLQVADSELQTIRQSGFVNERTSLHKPLDNIRVALAKLIRMNPPMGESQLNEFWWVGEETVERIFALHRMLSTFVDTSLDPVDGQALRAMRDDKACIRLAPDRDHSITAQFRDTHLLVSLPVRNEGKGRARNVTLLSTTSKLGESSAHPEEVVMDLDPNADGSLSFTYLPTYPDGNAQAEDSRFRLRIGFQDSLGEDEVGFLITIRDVGNNSFRGDVYPSGTIASPFCPILSGEFLTSQS